MKPKFGLLTLVAALSIPTLLNAADIDRKKVERTLSIQNRVDQAPRLARTAATQLGNAHIRSKHGSNLRRLRPQNLVLGARDVVLRELANC